MRYLILLALAGCASGPWTHPTKGAQEFSIDDFDCRQAAIVITRPDEPFTRTGLWESCMRARGWVAD